MPVNFPAWARLGLGVVTGLLAAFLSGGIDLGGLDFPIDEPTRAMLTAVVGALAAAGFVPPRPGEVPLSPQVRLVLTVATPVVTYLLVRYVDQATLRAILVGAVTFLAHIFIIPPQAKPAVA
jgi:hypothetical protein